MIEIRNLTKTWEGADAPVLDDISLSVDDGQMYALVGKSGAGKSTLLRCINGLASYESGSLKVDGAEIAAMSKVQLREFRRHVGMIFQQFSLLERATVYDNVALPMKCWKYSRAEIESKVTSLLDLVGLSEKRDSKPGNLSGGQKQRVAVARALTMEPRYLLCDEATSALDPDTANSILDLLMEINGRTGITVIVVTHQMEVVRRVCRRACVLEHGHIVSEGTVQDLFVDEPLPLRRILGERHAPLPDTGRNIQVSYYVDSPQDAALFSAMAAQLDVPFSIVRGGIQNYRDRDFGIFTLNVGDSHVQSVTNYLDAQGVQWRELSADTANIDVSAGSEDSFASAPAGGDAASAGDTDAEGGDAR